MHTKTSPARITKNASKKRTKFFLAAEVVPEYNITIYTIILRICGGLEMIFTLPIPTNIVLNQAVQKHAFKNAVFCVVQLWGHHSYVEAGFGRGKTLLKAFIVV